MISSKKILKVENDSSSFKNSIIKEPNYLIQSFLRAVKFIANEQHQRKRKLAEQQQGGGNTSGGNFLSPGRSFAKITTNKNELQRAILLFEDEKNVLDSTLYIKEVLCGMREEKILSSEDTSNTSIILSPRGDTEESRLKKEPSLKKISFSFNKFSC